MVPHLPPLKGLENLLAAYGDSSGATTITEPVDREPRPLQATQLQDAAHASSSL